MLLALVLAVAESASDSVCDVSHAAVPAKIRQDTPWYKFRKSQRIDAPKVTMSRLRIGNICYVKSARWYTCYVKSAYHVTSRHYIDDVTIDHFWASVCMSCACRVHVVCMSSARPPIVRLLPVHIHTHTHTQTHTHTYTYLHICIFTYIYIYIYIERERERERERENERERS